MEYVPPRQHQRAIVPGLLDGVVALFIVRAFRENRKFLIHITIQKREQRNDRQHNVRDKRGNNFGEGIGDSISN